MGQYHKIINYTKKECLNPNKFMDGLKAMEFGTSGLGAMTALSYLLVYPEQRGGGDYTDGLFKGRWKGDNIGIIGDYAEKDDNLIYDDEWYYRNCKDISIDVLLELLKDEYIKEEYLKTFTNFSCMYNTTDIIRIKKALGIDIKNNTKENYKLMERDNRGRFTKKK